LIQLQAGLVTTGIRIESIRQQGGVYVLETTGGTIEARFLINCGGLHSDRVAREAGFDPEAKIVPFRGEYYELVPERRHLVKALIYPVPNPAFPFLGVHFTKMIDGSVHAGPNAVLAFEREGYHKTDINCSDLFQTLTFPGFWKLAYKHFKDGLMEMYRSVSKRAFVRTLQQLIPEVTEDDLVPTHAGVRAQALMPDGKLVDDFLILNAPNAIHVCNAPSPAATASLEIAKAVANQVPDLRTAVTA
jgi:L-2-hydroxyglutarate oxidase